MLLYSPLPLPLSAFLNLVTSIHPDHTSPARFLLPPSVLVLHARRGCLFVPPSLIVSTCTTSTSVMICLLDVCARFSRCRGGCHSCSIVVRGWGPFAEDCWTKVKIGGITMHTPKPCSRCQIPQINQSTLEVRNEPRKTMDTFR